MAKTGLLFVGTDDGLALLSEPGAMGRWINIGRELRGGAVSAVWLERDNPLVVLAATPTGMQRSEDGGQSWRVVHGASVVALAGHRTAPRTVFALVTDGAIVRSDDAGVTWSQGCTDGTILTEASLLLDVSSDTERLVTANGNAVLERAEDEVWRSFGGELPAPLTYLAAAPEANDGVLALAGGVIYRCTSANSAWEPLAATPPEQSVAVAALGGATPVLLAGHSAGVARSDDNGATWHSTEADQPWLGAVTVLAPAAYHMDTVFAGSAGGKVGLSTDRGRTWRVLKPELPPIRVVAAARLI